MNKPPATVGEDGRRLAKRHGDTRLSHYRAMGIPAQSLLALMAKWCGIDDHGEIDLPTMLQEFDTASTFDAIHQRKNTVTPSQSLDLLNNDLVLDFARAFAGRGQ